MAIRLQASRIPQNPGVYFFRKDSNILYIGKAANLRARLRSYFNLKDVKRRRFPPGRPTSKILALLNEAQSLSWEILNSETEALIREAELIKKYRPKYNVLMRDDKNYFYVGFTKEKFPKIFITHQTKNNANYIGPFTEGVALKSVLNTLRRVFPYCTCKKNHARPCLNAKLCKCLGYCCTINYKLSTINYLKNIRSIKQILSGKNKSLLRALKKEMQKLSRGQNYEEAAQIRNQIRALEKIFEHRDVIKQDLPSENAKALRALESLLKINNVNRIEAYDIANIHGKFAYGSTAVFENGALKKDSYRLFKIRTVNQSNDPAMIKEVLLRRLKHAEWPIPQVVLIDGGQAQLNTAFRVIRTKFREIRVMSLTKNSKHIGDHIFIAGRRKSISLSVLPASLKNLILRLDSEAHRFAILHYRKSHQKNVFNSPSA